MLNVRGGMTLAALLLGSVAAGQSNDAPMNAKIARIGGPLGARVGEVFFKVHAATVAGDATELRKGCEAWTADVKNLDPLFTPEFTSFLTPLNWATAPRTYEWLVNVTHLAMDFKVVIGAVCAATPPNRAELLAAYAVASNAYALNRQMSLQLQTTK